MSASPGSFIVSMMPRHDRKPCSGCGLAFMMASNSATVAGPTLLASSIILAGVDAA